MINNSKQTEKISKLPIDVEKLKEFFIENLEEVPKEKYGLSWAGKVNAKKEALTPTTKTLNPQEKESKNWDETENVFIEGDNLEALKLLQRKYFEKIKMIYIDPPYNTGKDFIYKDNFARSTKEELEASGEMEEGALLTTNARTNGRFHSDWLNMMYSRLFLAHKLLKDDGVIFVSIDDNEVANLRLLMDEIFGEENLLSTHHIQVRYGNKSLNEKKDFQELVEYIFIYAKNKEVVKFKKPKRDYPVEKFNLQIVHNEQPTKTIKENGRLVDIWDSKAYKIEKTTATLDNFKETWISGSILTGTGHGKMYTKIIDKRRVEDGDDCLYRIHGIGEDGLGYRYYTNPKSQKSNRGKMYTKIPTIVLEKLKNGTAEKEDPIINSYDYSGDFGNIRHEGDMPFNGGKKPVKLIKQLMNYFVEKNYSVLDFFAGSGTTAHAVMDLNAEDGGNRKYLLVQLDEVIDKNDKVLIDIAQKELNEDAKISTITRERIRRAGKKILEDKKEELKKRKKPLDIGFRSFKVSNSNYRQWEKSDFDMFEEKLLEQAQLFVDKPLIDNYKKIDVIFETIVKEGFALSSQIFSEQDDKKWKIQDGERKMIVDFSDKVKFEDVEKMKLNENDIFVCFDSALTDNDKINIIKSVNLKVV